MQVRSRLEQHFSDLLREVHEAAQGAGGILEYSYIIAGFPVRLRFAGSGLVSKVTSAFAHLRAGEDLQPALTVYLWDVASTGASFPAILRSDWPPARVGARRPEGHQRFRAAFQPVENTVTLLDRDRNLALYVISDARRMPYYETSAPLRFLLNWWMAARGLQMVHAGAVGAASGGVLLVGKTGSGKSTTALACLRSRLVYAGDDHVLIGAESAPYIYSLYNSGKLHAGHIQRFPELVPSIWNTDRQAGEKAVVFIHQHSPQKTCSGFPLRAVLLPRIGNRAESKIERVSAAAGLSALAPSTLFGLPGTGPEAFETMARLVARVPCYAIIVGQDISAIPTVITRLLSQLDLGRFL